MNSRLPHQPAQPFFLKVESGERFCIYYPPVKVKKCLGSFIYIHPFAEEMNKSRRMIAMQSKALSELGYAVLQIDLFGCGDSSGDFVDATWEIWLEDIAAAEKWLMEKQQHSSIGLWGLRLGGTLALNYAKKSSSKFSTIILWQPVVNTENYLNQFLRLHLAGEMIAGEGRRATGTSHLRNELAAGYSVEIAGYQLSPALARSVSELNTTNLIVTSCPVHWFDITSESKKMLSSASENLFHLWRSQGVDLQVHFISCSQFWASQDITICPELTSVMAELLSNNLA